MTNLRIENNGDIQLEIAIDIFNSEKDFIQACIQQKSWAQKKLYEDHFAIMMGVCLRYAKDKEQAMDIVHDGFIKVFMKIHTYQPGTSLTAWIKRIMVTTSIDHYRRESLRKTISLSHIKQPPAFNSVILSKMQSTEILACIQKLSPMYRTIFNMHAIEGFSHREIADILNIKESTSRANLTKARNNLKELIYKHEIKKRK